jgi:hypothetical protein
MPFDKREAILQRMLSILQGIPGPAVVDGEPSIFRNRGEVPVEKMPALVLLDGRETINISTHAKGGILAPTVFTLRPQVFVILKPTNRIDNDGIGEELSDYRMKLLKAFSGDEDLIFMLGSNGEIQYLGHETDMQTGSTMLGQMQMNFSLNYTLNPKDF